MELISSIRESERSAGTIEADITAEWWQWHRPVQINVHTFKAAYCVGSACGYCTDMYLKSPVTPMLPTIPSPSHCFCSGVRVS